MQLVFFALLPFAILSTWFVKPGVLSCDHVVETLSSTWIIIAIFALASRWMIRAKDLIERYPQSIADMALSPSSLIWLWCITQPISLASTGWTALVLEVVQDTCWSLRIFGILMPSIILLVLVDWIHAARWTRLHGSRYDRIGDASEIISNVRLQSVQTWLIPVTMPIFVSAAMDVCAWSSVRCGFDGSTGAYAGTLLGCLLIALVMPSMWIGLTYAHPVDENVERIVKRAWFVSTSIQPKTLQWQTGGRCPNAMVVGMTRRTRKLFLTDALLQRLSDSQLTMVVLHELAHCERNHVFIRLAPCLVTISAIAIASRFLDGLYMAVLSVLVVVVFVYVLTAVCRWTEYDADRYALELSKKLPDDLFKNILGEPSSPAQCLEDALKGIHGRQNMNRTSWLHPTCESRVASIRSFTWLDSIKGLQGIDA